MTPVRQDVSPLRVVNPILVAAVVLLAAYGTLIVSSAVSGMDAGSAMTKKHLFGLAIGLIPLIVAWAFDYRKLEAWAGPLFILDAFLILMPLIPGLGATAKGAQLWLEIGGVRLMQPSEPGKIVFIIAMAAALSRYKGKLDNPRDVLKVLGLAAVPILLVVAVGDLGTGLVFVAITLGMLLIGGIPSRWFLVFALIAVLGVSAVLKFGLLEEYQVNRLLVFIDPARDPKGAGYNLEQSKIAIGSGEFTGQGLGSGTQGNLNFLPERHTDFIFSVLGEELGFVGVIVLLGLYLALLITALEIAASSRDLFGSLICAGIISMWTFQILENIGMTVGLMPITGIPLPFMSFGSSFMVTNMLAVGMLLSVWTRRYA